MAKGDMWILLPVVALVAIIALCPFKQTAICHDVAGNEIYYYVCGCWHCTGVPPPECVD